MLSILMYVAHACTDEQGKRNSPSYCKTLSKSVCLSSISSTTILIIVEIRVHFLQFVFVDSVYSATLLFTINHVLGRQMLPLLIDNNERLNVSAFQGVRPRLIGALYFTVTKKSNVFYP